MRDKKELLDLARGCLECSFSRKELVISDDVKEKFSEKKACFVTLTEKGELRGCIGSLEAREELWKNVITNTKNAAFGDPRFPPLEKNELDKIRIEISVLSPLKKLGLGREVFDRIDKEMGIFLKKGWNCATFLPQVWEQMPSKKEFLEHLSRKAGLEKDDWKSCELWFYRVEKIKED